jgi:hypothetical protein
MKNTHGFVMSGLAVVALGLLFPGENKAQIPPTHQLISESALLAGLAPGALFPFIDSTPRRIALAHVAITDATSNCAPGAAAPSNVVVVAGVAGGALVNVMTAASNTGIGSSAQCVFHVTIRPGVGGVPGQVTDIVVVNSNGSAALTGVNTITVSAQVF